MLAMNRTIELTIAESSILYLCQCFRAQLSTLSHTHTSWAVNDGVVDSASTSPAAGTGQLCKCGLPQVGEEGEKEDEE